MVLSAKLEKTGEIVYAWEFTSGHELRRKALDMGTRYLSPYPDVDCQVFPVDSMFKILHFRHAAKAHTNYNTHPESPEHQKGKQLIIQELRKNIDEEVKIVSEHPIPTINRIADVAVIYPDGFVHVHECQFAAQTTIELEQRTNDYESMGYSVTWWMGGKSATTATFQWLKESGRDYVELEISVSTQAS